MRGRIQFVLGLGRLLVELRPHLRGGRWLLAAMVASSLSAVGMESLGVGLLVPLLSLLLGGEDAAPMRPIVWMQSALPGKSSGFYVIAFCVAIAMAIGAKNVVLFLSQCLGARLQRRISVNLRQALFEKIHAADLSVLDNHKAGELTNTLITESERTLRFVESVLFLSQRLAMAMFYLGALCLISWQLPLLTTVLALGVGVCLSFLHRRLRRGGSDITGINQDVASTAQESFAGVRLIRATHSRQRFVDHFKLLLNLKAEVEESAARSHALLAPLAEIIAVTGAMSIVGCAYVFLVKPGLMLPSYLLAFGFVLLRFLPLINQIYAYQGHVLFMAGGVHKVKDWLDTPVFPRRPFGEKEFTGLRQGSRLEKLSYVYPDGKRALEEVSFEIPAGKTVALVGRSGSGKSTLASLLLRFRAPQAGRILADEMDYWEFTSESWHRRVAAVEQEAFLFHDTLARNIAFGLENASEKALHAVVKLTKLEDVVAGFPEGLQTVVGERGANLSGGQRQRLALARALIREPELLILDEATSALDPLSEREVQMALEAATSQRTVLVIAHRLSTIRNADHIVVLESGRVIEQGSWDTLIEAHGVFSELVRTHAQ